MATYCVGVDLGGTRIKAVAVSRQGEVLGRETRATHDAHSRIGSCAETIREVIAGFESALRETAMSVGLATPGLIATDSRSVACCPGKLDGIEGFDWSSALGRKQTVLLLNDAHAALVGEHWIGAARDFQNAILMTLGTGVGGAILSEGRLLRGAHGRAGILGHISLDPFGVRGCFAVPGPLEDWIGDQTVEDRTDGRFRSSEELVRAVRDGDPSAQAAWRKSIRALAVAIASYGLILDVEAVILGGGIAQAGADLFEPLARELDEVEWRPGGLKMEIVPALLGAWAGAIGAAKNAMDAIPGL
ncbi:MAG TPA: ROK family protein [Candidatus Limnocylindrales bacterium]|jgi:glucokinase|nr:ROK family protein [Candidatus Limnocylindrales bacterium]